MSVASLGGGMDARWRAMGMGVYDPAQHGYPAGGFVPNGVQGGFVPNGTQGGFVPNGAQGGFVPNGVQGGFVPNGYPPSAGGYLFPSCESMGFSEMGGGLYASPGAAPSAGAWQHQPLPQLLPQALPQTFTPQRLATPPSTPLSTPLSAPLCPLWLGNMSMHCPATFYLKGRAYTHARLLLR